MDTGRHTIEPAVQALYASDPEREWQRMDRHRTEFAVSLRALDAHLPPPPATVLDCGGGPGRYAIALAQRGYDVTLFDLSPELLALAKAHVAEAGVTLRGYEQGTATDLSRFADESFDAVLLMGPLYHLLDEVDRRCALAEAYRVVKPGGPVFAAFIARYAGHIDAAAYYPERAAEISEAYAQIAATGLQPPASDGSVAFVAYFAHPNEVAPLCAGVGLEMTALLGVEGAVAGHETQVNALTGEAWETWVAMNYEIAQDPVALGGVEHLLAVCRKPRWRPVLRELIVMLNDEGLDYVVVGGTLLALHGLTPQVRDIDLEMSKAAAYRFQARFASHAVLPVAWRASDTYRSHFGRFDFEGVQVEVMADLECRLGDRWVRSLCRTRETLTFEGLPVNVIALEEDALAYLRSGRLERAALALPRCDRDRLLALWKAAVRDGLF